MGGIRIQVNQDHWNLDEFQRFSGGEVHVDIDFLPTDCASYNIKARLQSSEDIMQLMMVADALGRRYPERAGSVTIPYMPYSRQDRMCSEGQHFGLKVITDMFKTLPQKVFYTYDCHSDVCESLMDENTLLVDIHQSDIIRNSFLKDDIGFGNVRIVSPDKGAIGKARRVADECGSPYPVIACTKTRDPKTGWLMTDPIEMDLLGQNMLIVDDICDGGATFLGLAEELKKASAGKISLYVTHAIFSRGLGVFDKVIDEIYTTDSFIQPKDSPIKTGSFYHDRLQFKTLKL